MVYLLGFVIILNIFSHFYALNMLKVYMVPSYLFCVFILCLFELQISGGQVLWTSSVGGWPWKVFVVDDSVD